MLASTGRRLVAGLLSSSGKAGSSSALLNGALVAAADSILFSSSSIKPSSLFFSSRSLSTDTDIRKVLADKIPEQQVREKDQEACLESTERARKGFNRDAAGEARRKKNEWRPFFSARVPSSSSPYHLQNCVPFSAPN
jgi:hypothetical protein